MLVVLGSLADLMAYLDQEGRVLLAQLRYRGHNEGFMTPKVVVILWLISGPGNMAREPLALFDTIQECERVRANMLLLEPNTNQDELVCERQVKKNGI